MSVHFYYFCSSFVLPPLAQALNSCASRHAFSHFFNFPGFLGYGKTLGSEETLNADCFLRTRLLEGHVEFLRLSF